MRWAILIICGLIILLPSGLIPTPTPGPDKPDDVQPEPAPTELARKVAAALEAAPPGTADLYAGWFMAISDTLKNGDEPVPVLRSAWVKAKSNLGIPDLLSGILSEYLSEFEGQNPDRAAYAKRWDELAAACLEAK